MLKFSKKTNKINTMKNSVLLVIIFATILTVSCGNKNKTKDIKEGAVKIESKTPTLELIWETDSLLTTCEAVLYDVSTQTIYVSNVNRSPWEKDHNGFISTINTKGEITNLKWMEGLSGPKGLGISNGKLYVNDIDRVLEIAITSQKITNSFMVENNPQLNDITVDPEGVVYVSGSKSNVVYQIKDEIISKYAADSLQLKRLNGLLHQKEGLYYLDSGTHEFGVLDYTSKIFKKLTTDIGHGDGIVKLKNGDFITSSWKGEIFYINSKNWSKTQLLDTRDQSINAADIDFIPETQTLLVPTFFHNKVMAYKLKFE